ncbi:hypothetical protein H4219_001700 [Mycoemilia scoparia]|uniref:Rhodanese domain-containing protein n=1 Tax=Mycoemilia scoparia TaxID=417184 RepID=A0A9W8A8Y8_9FUNG|nr:hypothetical protein H4219_001700 [Mycoemilia scoparia]
MLSATINSIAKRQLGKFLNSAAGGGNCHGPAIPRFYTTIFSSGKHGCRIIDVSPSIHLAASARSVREFSTSPSLFSSSVRPIYYNPESKSRPPHELDIDAPYPEAAGDGYITASFYSFISIPEEDLEYLRKKLLRDWGDSDLGVHGRIYIWSNGINAQLSLPRDKVKDFRGYLESAPLFSGKIPPFNWALSHGKAFKSLHIRIRPLVAAGGDVDLDTISNQPTYLRADEWDREIKDAKDKGMNTTIFDMRNFYEFEIGHFEGATKLDVDTFREQMDIVTEMCNKIKKDEPIYMYCTGGIRCSVAGAILKSKGHKDVRTLEGGIIAYGRYVKEHNNEKSSLFRGKNFTFDKRLGERITDEVLAKCFQCGKPCDHYSNCVNGSCNLLFLQCHSCATKYKNTCGNPRCLEKIKMPPEIIREMREPAIWNYRQRVRPNEAFASAGISLDNQ